MADTMLDTIATTTSMLLNTEWDRQQYNDSDDSSVNKKSEWLFRSMESCLNYMGEDAFKFDGVYCNATWDTILCWPATPAGGIAKLPCPPLSGLDETKFGFKKCSLDGRWEGRESGDFSKPAGWTNYTGCYTDSTYEMYAKIFGHVSPGTMKRIAIGTRLMEIVGLSISSVCLVASLFIFCYFQNLRCHRTRIHRNLFLGTLVHAIVRLLMHIDQQVARQAGGMIAGSTSNSLFTISNTPYICEILITLVEYTKSCMFMWMFIEGLYLHSMIVITVMTTNPNYLRYYLAAWGIPVINTVIWAVVNAMLHKERCWFGMALQNQYWILEGPRILVLFINFLFLLNIIRVLVTKLRESHSTEAVQVRKAVKAAIVLLPLLGVTHFSEMISPPTHNAISFGVWSYISHFLSSFQGVFISLLYCFLNSEVRETLLNHWERYQLGRGNPNNRRLSRNASIFTSVTEIPAHQVNPKKTSATLSNGSQKLLNKETGETCI